MTFTDYCLQEAANYGKKGNKTLECLSATVERNGEACRILEMKTYFDGLIGKEGTDLSEKGGIPGGIPQNIPEGMQAVTLNFPGTKVADTVVYRAEGRETSEYAVNLLTTGISSDGAMNIPEALERTFEASPEMKKNMVHDLQAVSQGLPNMSASRLNNIGLRFDADGRVTGAKYYFNIKKELPVSNCFDADIAFVVRSIAEGTAQDGRMPEPSENACGREQLKDFGLPEQYGYFPTLMGINIKRDGKKEVKVYFDCGRRAGKHGDVVDKACRAMNELGVSKALPEEDVRKLYDNGIFLRGIGLNPNEPQKIKLYVVERA